MQEARSAHHAVEKTPMFDPQARLKTLCGMAAPSQFSERSRIRLKAPAGIVFVEIDLVRQDGERVRGLLAGPEGPWNNLPALLCCHAHGLRYDIGAAELFSGRPALLDPPYGETLARQGYVAFAIDLSCFGARQNECESSASKRHLWQGRTMFGEMLEDLGGAIDFLTQHAGIDPERIGAFGISMGATLAFWLAALDQRVKVVAHLCCFADLAALVETGAHDLHGPYMTVPGLVQEFTTGQIAGLVAPRPQFAAMGALDALTPPAAVARAVADTRRAYEASGAPGRFQVLVGAETGHVETPQMREALLRFVASHL
ncbi:Dienelactone hydrolase [Rhabdaerophilaceae bacterium]